MCITVKDRFLNMTTNDMLSFTIFENRNVKVLIIKGFFKVSFVIFLQNILVNLYKRREFDSCLQFFTNQISQNVDYINAFEFFYCQIRENKCTNMG